MSFFADTNWLEALYFAPDPGVRGGIKRTTVVNRRMKMISARVIVSELILLEARNVFSRVSGAPNSAEWQDLEGDLGHRISIQPLDWDRLKERTNEIVDRYAHKARIGTVDSTIVASASLAGARELLSFDETLKALAECHGLQVFPPLGPAGLAVRAQLRR